MMTLLKNDLKHLKNLMVIMSFVLALNLIIQVISFNPKISIMLFYVIVLLFVLIVPMINLNYLFNQTKENHFASLPLTKGQSFIVRYLSGLISIVIPVMMYCLFDYLFSGGLVFKNVISLALMIVIYYNIANLTVYLTKSVLMNLVSIVVILVAPVILYLSLFVLYQGTIPGVNVINPSAFVVSIICPVAKMINASVNGLNSTYSLLYLSYALFSFVLAAFICVKRDCSVNKQGFAFNFVGPIIQIMIIFTISWVITTLLFSTNLYAVNTTNTNFVKNNLIASLITTLIIQYIYNHKIKLLLVLKYFTLVFVATVVIFVGTKDYIQNYIPDNVETVMIDSRNIASVNEKYTIKDTTSINEVKNIHKLLLDHIGDDGYCYIRINYLKKDGSRVDRGYWVNQDNYNLIVNQFNEGFVKSWYSEYYDLSDKLLKKEQLSYTLSYEGESYNIDTFNDITLFKTILDKQLADFCNNPQLLKDVKYNGAGYLNSEGIVINYDSNDPLSITLKEYHKIKAN